MQFKDYAKIYDLIYQDKDYAAETGYVLSVIDRHRVLDSKALLELGCGTGNYSAKFSEKGYEVTGLDLSEDMIAIAENRSIADAKFMQGDIRHYKLHKTFPLIVSLFHVFSYLNSDTDVKDFFARAYDHLEKDGLLVFDFWNGDGVMADPPGNRTKDMQNDRFVLKRRTTATHLKENHTVEVAFDFEVKDQENDMEHRFSELHRMRYFFKNDIERLAGDKFEVMASYGWMLDRAPDSSNWYALYVLRKK